MTRHSLAFDNGIDRVFVSCTSPWSGGRSASTSCSACIVAVVCERGGVAPGSHA